MHVDLGREEFGAIERGTLPPWGFDAICSIFVLRPTAIELVVGSRIDCDPQRSTAVAARYAADENAARIFVFTSIVEAGVCDKQVTIPTTNI